MLDSLVAAPAGERIDHGELAAGSLAWLDAELGADDRPTFVCLHHPPVDIGPGADGADPAARPGSAGRGARPARRTSSPRWSGTRTPRAATTFAGRPVLVGGGVASTVPLDAEPYPVVWEAGPPTLAFHLVHDDGRLTTPLACLAVGRRRLMLLAFDTATPLVTVALHDGEDVVLELVSERPLQHGEQLAPLVDRALREAGLVRQDLTAIGVGVGPGPFTGLRVGLVTARTLGFVLELPVYGVCTLDVLAVEAADTHAVTGEFVVATDARRREVYLASYDAAGVRLDGPVVGKPADHATERTGRRGGRRPLPGGVPAPSRADGAQRRLAGPGDRRGTRRAARSRTALPAPARRRDARDAEAGLVRVRPATEADVDAIVVSEADNLGADAWSAGLVAEGVAGRLPTVHYLVAESEGRLVGHAVASLVAEVAELQRIAVAERWRRRGVAGALLDEVVALAVRAGADRLLLEVREDNAAALAFYTAAGFVEVDRRRRYYRDGASAVVLEHPVRMEK